MAVPWSVAFGLVVMLLAAAVPVAPLLVFTVATLSMWLVVTVGLRRHE